MNKQEFLSRLEKALNGLPEERLRESLDFYTELIEDRIEDGMSEEEALASMGNPEAIAESVLNELPAVPRAVAKTGRKSKVLLWTLLIVGSPLWLTLGLAFACVALSVYLCIWILAMCLWIVAIMFILIGPLTLAFSLWGVIDGNLPFACAHLGAGLFCTGLGLVCLPLALSASKKLVHLSKAWVLTMLSPFKKIKAPAQPLQTQA